MDDKMYERNINGLLEYNSLLIQLNLDQLNVKDYSNLIFKKVDNKQIPLMIKNNKAYYLSSYYDPMNEAEILLQNLDFSKDSIYIVIGLGAVEHIRLLSERVSKESRILVYEPNINVVKYVLTNYDVYDLFKHNPILLFSGEDAVIKELILVYMGINLYNLVQNTQIIMLPNYKIYMSETHQFLKLMHTRITSTLKTFGTSLEDMLNGFTNEYTNIDYYMESNSIMEIKGLYENKPAIIVSAGPSLDKNIHLLRKAQGKALIITCDASYDACKKNNVEPDAIASIERDEPTYTFYYKDKTFDKDLVLVGPGVLWPKIFDEYEGKKILMSRTNDGVHQWWADFFENIEFVNQGHSSATVAFATAKMAGCNPIILIGQDLAYTSGKVHSNLTHHDLEGNNDDKRSDGTMVKDYNGNLIPSHEIYVLFKTWFEYEMIVNPTLKVIDATEGGAYIEGSEVMTLDSAIKEYCVEDIGEKLYYKLKDVIVEDEYKRNKYKEVIEDIEKQIENLRQIAKKAEDHIKILDGIKQKYNMDTANEKKLIEIVKKMQKGDSIIQSILYEENVLKVFYRQMITQTIIYVKKLGNKLDNETIKKNYDLQYNLMFIIKNSTDVIIEQYEMAKRYINNQLGSETIDEA